MDPPLCDCHPFPEHSQKIQLWNKRDYCSGKFVITYPIKCMNHSCMQRSSPYGLMVCEEGVCESLNSPLFGFHKSLCQRSGCYIGIILHNPWAIFLTGFPPPGYPKIVAGCVQYKPHYQWKTTWHVFQWNFVYKATYMYMVSDHHMSCWKIALISSQKSKLSPVMPLETNLDSIPCVDKILHAQIFRAIESTYGFEPHFAIFI